MLEVMAIIPNVSTQEAAAAEWAACLLYWYYAPKRYDRRRSLLFMVLMLPALLGLEEAMSGLIPENLLGNDIEIGIILASACKSLTGVPILLAGTALITGYGWTNCMYIAGKAYICAELIASAACVIYDVWVMAGGGMGTAQVIVFYGGTYAMWLLLMRKSVEKETGFLTRVRVSVNQCILVIMIVVTTFFVSNSSMVITGVGMISDSDMLNYTVMRLVGDICGFTILWMLARYNSENETKAELAAVKNTLNLQYQQYLSFRDTSEYISRQNHDLKHQLQALQESEHEAERKAYIKEMERMIALNEAWNVTGNSTLDSILTQKKIYCIGHDIEFSCQAAAKELEQISVRDICSLFGNIIDNAIEYVSGFEDKEKRVIWGNVEVRKSFLVVTFKNYYEGPPLQEGKLPATSKQDKEQHGYGLKSIRFVADKYNGSMSIRTEGNWFIIRVLIPMKAEIRSAENV